MKNLLNFVVLPLLATALTAMLTVAGVSADSGTRMFQFLAADESLGIICQPGGVPCPDEAIASSTGDSIEISGVGMLTTHPKTIMGGGVFNATALEVGGDPVQGEWTAVKLLSFKSYGPSPDLGFPENFHSGNAMIRIELFSGGEWIADAVLRLGCRLPNANFPPSTIEGVRVNVQGGLNFNREEDPRATLFIEMVQP